MSGEETLQHVTVRVPRVLAELTGCERAVEVRGATIGEALLDLVTRRPALGVHIFDDSRRLRRHVLCFRNGVAVERRAALDDPVAAGDELTLMNSVAGG